MEKRICLNITVHIFGSMKFAAILMNTIFYIIFIYQQIEFYKIHHRKTHKILKKNNNIVSTFPLYSRLFPPIFTFASYSFFVYYIFHRTSLFFFSFALQITSLIRSKLCCKLKKNENSYLFYQRRDVPLIGFGRLPQQQTDRLLGLCVTWLYRSEKGFSYIKPICVE